MSNILKLVRMDRALIKPYNKYFLVVLLAPLIVVYSFKEFIPGIVFCMVMVSMTSIYTFTIAEKNDLNRLYGLLPVNKSDIVLGRYLFTAILGLAGAIVSVAVNSIILILFKVSFTLEDILYGLGVGLILYFFFTAVQLPGYFKLGAIKGRFFSFIPLLGLFFMGELVKALNVGDSPGYTVEVLNNPYGMLVCSVLLCVALYGISIGITQKLYNNMEL